MKSEFDVIAWWISFFTSGVFATTFFWYAPKLMLSPQMRLWSCFAFTHVRANYARVSDRRVRNARNAARGDRASLKATPDDARIAIA